MTYQMNGVDMDTDSKNPETNFLTKEFVQNALGLLQRATGLNTSVYAQTQKKEFGWESWWSTRKYSLGVLYTVQITMRKSGVIHSWWVPGPRVIEGMSARANTVKLRGVDEPRGSGSIADSTAVFLSDENTLITVEEMYGDLVRVMVYSRLAPN